MINDPAFDLIEGPNIMNTFPTEDKIGLRVTSGTVTLNKDAQNKVGITIGGGIPYCPCLYVVQVFEQSPAHLDQSLAAGDEIMAVDGISTKGCSRTEVARLIQRSQKTVSINFNKLHVEKSASRPADIALKKIKHKLVENMSSSTADVLGLSRAILVNDSLVQKIGQMNEVGINFKRLAAQLCKFTGATHDLSQVHKDFGAVMLEVGCREPQLRASEAFSQFGTVHIQMERRAVELSKSLRQISASLATFTQKVIPDMKMTLRKYLDAKFEYLSYCLKVKEMDDEEYLFIAIREPLYRLETGNYAYRQVLRMRQISRDKFSALRSDVMVKLELLHNKHVQDMINQLQQFIQSLSVYYKESNEQLRQATIFPLELDLCYTSLPNPESKENRENDEDSNDESDQMKCTVDDDNSAVTNDEKQEKSDVTDPHFNHRDTVLPDLYDLSEDTGQKSHPNHTAYDDDDESDNMSTVGVNELDPVHAALNHDKRYGKVNYTLLYDDDDGDNDDDNQIDHDPKNKKHHHSNEKQTKNP